jgi:hypothetical protein
MQTKFHNLKKTTAFIIFILASNCARAQNPVIEWQQCLGGSSTEVANCIRQTNDGGYIMAGHSQSISGDISGNHGGDDMWVIKLNATGGLAWQRCLGGTNNDQAFAVEQTQDGGYIVVGQTKSNDGDVTGLHSGFAAMDAWVVKLDTSGALTWQKTLGGSKADAATGVKQTPDGGFAIVGYTRSVDGDVTENHGNSDLWLVKLSSSGILEWQKCFGGTADDTGQGIQLTSDGGYVLAGETASNNGDVSGTHGGNDFWVVKLSATANIEWQKAIGGNLAELVETVRQTSDGGYVIVGETSSNNGDVTGNHNDVLNTYDAWVVKLNALGTLEWQKCLGGSSIDRAFDVMETTDNGFIVVGETRSADGDVIGNHGDYDAWMVKLNNGGALVWQKCWGGSAEESLLSIQQTADSGCILVGSAASTDGDVVGFEGGLSNFNDIWVLKIAAEGLATTTFDKPALTVSPNPVGSVLQITAADQARITAIRIMDMKGNMVLEQTGNCENVAVSTLARGTYILEAISKTQTLQTKFVKN